MTGWHYLHCIVQYNLVVGYNWGTQSATLKELYLSFAPFGIHLDELDLHIQCQLAKNLFSSFFAIQCKIG